MRFKCWRRRRNTFYVSAIFLFKMIESLGVELHQEHSQPTLVGIREAELIGRRINRIIITQNIIGVLISLQSHDFDLLVQSN